MNESVPRIVVKRSRSERRVTFAVKLLILIVLVAVVASACLDFLGRVRSVSVILIGATFFTYVIYPLVKRLNERMPLVWSIVTVYFGIALVAGFGIAVVVPALATDLQTLVKSSPEIVHNAQAFVADPNNPILARLPESVRTYLATLPEEVVKLAQRYAGDAAQRAVEFLLSTVALIATVVVIPVISIYLMMEWPGILAALIGALPPGSRVKTRSVLHDIDRVLGGFIRGQFTVGATIGACITVVLLVMHVKYAVLIGVAAGLFDIIPYVGAIVAFVPSVLLAFFNDGLQHAVIIAIAFVVIFQLEGHVIAPKIVSDSVGLSPLMVIVSILIGGELGGIAGMFLSVPIAAMLRVIVLHSIPTYPGDAPIAAAAAAGAVAATTGPGKGSEPPTAAPLAAAKKAQGARP
jgi:predicted PurR-regulated permease PerM